MTKGDLSLGWFNICESINVTHHTSIKERDKSDDHFNRHRKNASDYTILSYDKNLQQTVY